MQDTTLRLRSVLALVASTLLASACANDLPTGLAPTAGTGDGGSGSTVAGNTASATHAAASGTSVTSGAGGMAPSLGNLTMTLDDAAPNLDLKDRVDLRVTIDPKGYTGPLDLTADDLSPQGVTSMLAMSSVTLDGTTVVKVTFTLETATDTPPATLPFSVTGAVGQANKVVSGNLSVHSALTVHIPLNVGPLAGTVANPYKMAFGDYPTVITAPANISAANPVVIRFFNDDNAGHEIHGSQGAQGFPHDNGTIAPHTMDATVRNVTAKGTYDYYLHDQNAALTVGRIVIQ